MSPAELCCWLNRSFPLWVLVWTNRISKNKLHVYTDWCHHIMTKKEAVHVFPLLNGSNFLSFHNIIFVFLKLEISVFVKEFANIRCWFEHLI